MSISSASLLDLAEKYHLFPFVVLFIVVGMLTTATMLISLAFRCLGEVVEFYFDFRVRVVDSRRRFEERDRPRKLC